MGRTVKLLQIMLFILAPAAAAAAENSHASQSLYNLLSPIKTLSAQFVQTITDANGDPYATSSGVFSVAEPNRVRWEVIEPLAQQIVSDGNLVWVYDPDLEQVIVQSYDANIGASPASLFSGDLQQLNRDYGITYQTNESALETYILTPKKPGAFYQRLQIDFVQQRPVGLAFIDSLGQMTRIELNNVVLNSAFAESVFIFDIPPDVDVINNGD